MHYLAVLGMFSVLLLAGCGTGLDKKVNLEGGDNALEEIREIITGLNPQEQAAVRWTLTLMSQGVEGSKASNTLRKMMQ